jgi:alkylation response protein AidB-like acyl-CoA dehydrogenase
MDGNANLPGDHERSMLRDAIRTLLEQHWPSDKAKALAAEPAAVAGLWRVLAEQGCTVLGADPASGGLREILAVMAELGRAACPAPMLDAAIVNTLLAESALGDAGLSRFLDALHTGQAYACMSFGALDPDRGAGGITVSGGRVSGTVAFVDAAAPATHFVVFDAGAPSDGPSVAIVERTAEKVRLTPTRTMGMDGLCKVAFADAPAVIVPVAAERVGDLLSLSRLCYAARAWGAADRAFELAVQYVKIRQQFGQPVGRFQAIQHKLANNLIALMGVQACLDNAASHFDRGIAEWRTFAAAAFAYAHATLRQVALETHHAFGAIGYAEDHEAPRHFKRIHLDIVRHGGGRRAREELADRYLGETKKDLPEFDLGAEGNAFRREVRAWLAEHWSPPRRAAYEADPKTHREHEPQFALDLGKTGWLGLTWPRKFGGLERSPYELLALLEELNRADAPRAGAPIQAASWMIYGTPEQQARYLPEILRGEVVYGMWYSEPNSGSDLASLRTRAVRDGDGWVINGEKIWTTTYWGDYMWLAARTDPAAKPPHAGISMFIVRTDTPGITRRPIRTMYDGEFCNTFFDNVAVGADALVGEVNRGWEVLTGSLGTERAFIGATIMTKLARQFEELCDHLRTLEIDGRPMRLDPIVRDTIGGLAAYLEAGRQLSIHPVSILARGAEPTWEAAVPKVFAGELLERFCQSALDMLGMAGTLSAGNDEAPMRGRLEQKLRHSLMWVISLGTNEIQRSMIAQRGLGLPR